MINIADKQFSVREQCQILGLNRSTYYYKPAEIDEYTLTLMHLLDKQYTKTPFYGVDKMKKYLKDEGYAVGSDKVRTLLRTMGLYAIYPKPFTSQGNVGHKIYPYLLNGVNIIRSNQVWSADITYVKLLNGFAYLVAIIDWYSRYVLRWVLSNTLDSCFCVECLKDALQYRKPDIFNTDQGSQFTSQDFTSVLLDAGISVSMDGRGRVFDNIFVERLWRTVKYEDIYIKGYDTIPATREGLTKYFEFYNTERYHESLDYKTPLQVYETSNSTNSGNIMYQTITGAANGCAQ
jgi:putative transposase